MDTLLIDRRGVLVGEQREVGTDTGAEPSKFQGEVEPPARVALPEDDHQQSCQEEAAGDATAAVAHYLTALVVDRLAGARREHADEDPDRNDQEHAEKGCHPVVLFRVVDLEARGVDRRRQLLRHAPSRMSRHGPDRLCARTGRTAAPPRVGVDPPTQEGSPGQMVTWKGAGCQTSMEAM